MSGRIVVSPHAHRRALRRAHAWLGRAVVVAAVAAPVVASCTSPRPAREAIEHDLSGEWAARAAPLGAPAAAADVIWMLALAQGEAGRLEGAGEWRHGEQAGSFQVVGVRGEQLINLELHFDDGRTGRYEGSMADVSMLTGNLAVDADTVPLVFTREP